MQDIDNPPGTGAFIGKVHANILMALGCVGAITNGTARELPGIEASGFQVFAGRLAISRAYIHVVEYGGPVEVGGLTDSTRRFDSWRPARRPDRSTGTGAPKCPRRRTRFGKRNSS